MITIIINIISIKMGKQLENLSVLKMQIKMTFFFYLSARNTLKITVSAVAYR